LTARVQRTRRRKAYRTGGQYYPQWPFYSTDEPAVEKVISDRAR
jgi:hypothetical protein